MAMGGGGTGGAGGGGGTSTGQKRMFITSAAYAGTAVSGICQAAADSVSLGGTWVPWLSFGADVTPRNAIDEVKGAGPWVRLDGMVAFANHAQLATAPSVPLEIDEHGQTIAVSDVWTGTLTGGSYSGSDCHNWGASNYYGSIGRSSSASDWTAYTSQTVACNNTAHVYCFEQ